jgi:D-alanyl-D-alanine carboxypeptidase/D-alanyl-D-alanine-endopeptidase (penicillin-binding protein 4)
VPIVRSVLAGVLYGLLLTLVPLAQAADPLPDSVEAALQRYRLGSAGLSLYVHAVGEREPMLALAPDEPRNPASVIKLLTTLAALEELGPAYRFRTEAYATGRLVNGRLDGDLYLKGYGDPYLVIEQFWRFLRGLRQRGIESIGGDLVFDQSYFAGDDGDRAEFDGQDTRAYNVLPRALLVNFQAVNIRFIPQESRLRVVADPPVPLDNRIRLKKGPCRGGGWTFRVAGNARLRFAGEYPAACGEYEMFRVVTETGPYLNGVFRALWTELGGRLHGRWREAATPAEARLLHTYYSPPLADVVRLINKYSNNVMTRQLYLTLGAEHGGAPGTVEKGAAAVQAWLERRGLSASELVLDNGAGLSRDARISARSLGRVLLAAWNGPYMPEFASALPVAAVDGTLKNRFAGDLAGQAHLKTGSLDGVRSLAGYVRNAAGQRVVIVYLHNDPDVTTHAAEAVQDALLEWVYRRPLNLTAEVRSSATPSDLR